MHMPKMSKSSKYANAYNPMFNYNYTGNLNPRLTFIIKQITTSQSIKK